MINQCNHYFYGKKIALIAASRSWLTLILHTAGRKTASLEVVAVTVHVLAMVAEVPAPRVCRGVLRRRPEVGVVRETFETVHVVPVAARKGSESAGVGCPGIW